MKRWGRCECCHETVLGVTAHWEPRPLIFYPDVMLPDVLVFRCEACEAHERWCAT